MPKPKVTVEDLQQMFDKSLCIFKNKPYYITRVGEGNTLALNLLTQREELIAIDQTNCSAPTQRLGYVNVHGGVVYCSRIPVRRYKVGLSKENFVANHAAFCEYEHGTMAAVAQVSNLRGIELADCLMGRYPSLESAVERLKQGFVSAVAFDRQFAVCRQMQVYYKNNRVGKAKLKAGELVIEFGGAFKHLSILLDGNYEKAVSNPR